MIHSGNETLVHLVSSMLAPLQPPESIHLVYDDPRGYALLTLPKTPPRVVVITRVTSPSYLIDLMELKPQGLVARSLAPQEILTALTRVARGEFFYDGPKLEDGLQHSERAVLRHLAWGLENEQIAQALGIAENTVYNRLVALRDKLQAKSRVELALYYFGMLPKMWGGGNLTP